MKRLALVLVLPLLLGFPGTAAADVIFDPADADDLAATLAEAYTDQGVCYGWDVTVDNVGSQQESVGSNFGAGKSVRGGDCDTMVEFTATITYTSESAEAEDSAAWDVSSTPSGVTRADLGDLGIDFDGLTGDDPDVPIGKAITALPLLAADKGLGKGVAATPDTAPEPADAQLTDDPGSDWWRSRGQALLIGVGLMVAGALFAAWVLWSNRSKGADLSPVPDHDPEPEAAAVPDAEPEPSAEVTPPADPKDKE